MKCDMSLTKITKITFSWIYTWTGTELQRQMPLKTHSLNSYSYNIIGDVSQSLG